MSEQHPIVRDSRAKRRQHRGKLWLRHKVTRPAPRRFACPRCLLPFIGGTSARCQCKVQWPRYLVEQEAYARTQQ